MANGMKTVKKTIRTYVPASANGGHPNDLSTKFKTLTMAEPVKSKKEISQKEFETKLVKDHNEYRAKHGAPPLELSREVCARISIFFCFNFLFFAFSLSAR